MVIVDVVVCRDFCFFFSSRRRHTRCLSDWSSDVCSSDLGDEVTRILDLLGRRRLTVKAIVSTHAHIDHVGGLSKLHQYTGAPVLMHRDDLPLYQAMDVQASFMGVLPPSLPEVDQLLKDGRV